MPGTLVWPLPGRGIIGGPHGHTSARETIEISGLRARFGLFRWWLRELPFRTRAAILGHNIAQWNRLSKAGVVSVGPHTYHRPLVRYFPPEDAKLIVGSYSSLAEDALIMIGGDHGAYRVTTYPHRPRFKLEGWELRYNVPSRDTVIGSDVWLCDRSYVRSGVRIGDGAVVATCSVVTKDVPPYAIVAGNPARLVRYRHTPEQIEALLEIKWWDWPDADVCEAAPLLETTDVDAFIQWARKNKSHLISPDGRA